MSGYDERDFAEEAYWRAFCPACGVSPCEVDGEHYNTDEADRIAEVFHQAAADQAGQETQT